MRVVKKETGKAEEQKEFVMCRNVAHMDRDDHCNPKRLYVVKRSTIPRTAKELSECLCFLGKFDQRGMMMFGKHFKRQGDIRSFAGFFGLYSAEI
jgi:hypothetical protein